MPESRTFEEYARADATALLRLAVFLAGEDQDGEDLAQECLARLARAWRRRPPDDPHRYARRILTNLARDRWRRRRRTPDNVSLDVSPAASGTPFADVDERDAVLRALAQLPARQRAVLVLRFYEDLSESAIAGVLGCSVSSVKTHTARGLDRLRGLVDPTLATTEDTR